MSNIKLKNILAENMRRFGTKNLNESASGNLKYAKKQSYNTLRGDVLAAAEDLAIALEQPTMDHLPIVHHAIQQLKKWTDAKKPAPISVYILVDEAPALLDKMQAKSKRAWDEMQSHWGGIQDAIMDEDVDEYVTDLDDDGDEFI